MFRKRTKKVGAKNNLRRKRAINENAIDGGDNNNEEDDDDEQNDYTQIGLSIRKTMKKQKILASMPMTTPGGVSSSSFPRNNKNNNQSNNNNNNNNDDNNSNNNKDNDGNDQSFMAKKHQNNMEDFIEKQIATNNDTIANARPKGNAEEDVSTRDEDDNSNNNSNNSEEGLYKQLAREVTNTGEIGGGGENNNNNSDNMVDSRNDADEDQGALLVGTGIAEVILPTTSHRPVASSTSMGYVRNTNNLFLSSAVPENQRHKHKMPDTTPKPFVKFRKQYNVNNNINNNNQDSNNSNNQTNNSNSNSNNEHQQKDNEHDNVNNTRQGFDAFRGKETPSSSSDNNNNNDRDNKNNNRGKRTGKSRDDQAYGHFMKTAIAGRKMR